MGLSVRPRPAHSEPSISRWTKATVRLSNFTLPRVRLYVEKLWTLSHRFHREGSAALTALVEELKALLYSGWDRFSAWVQGLNRDRLQKRQRSGCSPRLLARRLT
jgi:hypothetical protein